MPVLSESHPKSQIPKECHTQSQRCVPRKQAFRWLMVRGEEQGRAFHGEFNLEKLLKEVQFSSVAQSCPTLCSPMDCSMPGLPVHRQLPELTQTHVHWVSDAIQQSHPLVPFSSCLQSFPASGFFPMSQFFATGGQGIGVSASASVLPMNIQDWFPSGWISLQSKGLSRIFPNTTGGSAGLFVMQLLRACVMLIYETKAIQWILGKVALETVGLLVLTIADTNNDFGLQNHCRWWLQPWS